MSNATSVGKVVLSALCSLFSSESCYRCKSLFCVVSLSDVMALIVNVGDSCVS